MSLIQSLKKILSNDHYNKFWIIFILMLISVFLELIGLGAVIPIIKSVLSEQGFSFSIFKKEFNFSTYVWLAIMVIIYLIKNAYLSFFQFYSSNFIHNIQVDLSSKLYKGYINLPHSEIKKKNSSFFLRNIITEVNTFSNSTQSIIILLTEILVFLAILIFLFFIEPFVTIGALVYFSFFGLIIYFFFKEKNYKWGLIRQDSDQKKIKFIQESFDGITEIKIFKLQNFFYEKFFNQIFNSSKMALLSSIASFLPRYIFEILTVIFVSLVLIFLKLYDFEQSNIIIIISLLGVSIFRLLPSMNKILVSLQQIKYNLPVIELLNSELEELDKAYVKQANNKKIIKEFSFSKLNISNLSFSYNKKKIFENIDLEILNNKAIGLVGESGSGKSTLVDIISGLLLPDEGNAYFENKSKEKFPLTDLTSDISYVPQNILILDDTLKNNIILNNGYDEELFSKVIKDAKLDSFLKNLSNKENSMIGERGNNISGGQKQRIGLARALYSNPKFLILDESTNALDDETEKQIFETFRSIKGKVTMLIVTHNKENLYFCDKILNIKNKKIYNEI